MNRLLALIAIISLGSIIPAAEGHSAQDSAGAQVLPGSDPLIAPAWQRQRQQSVKVSNDRFSNGRPGGSCCPMRTTWQQARRSLGKVDSRNRCCQTVDPCCNHL